ncbi:MAG: ABC transporter substrate-binding protein [Burkholderiales bacterium]
MAVRAPRRIARTSRRNFIAAGAAAAAALGMPALLRAQPKTVKIGLIHPMTGMFAYNGAQAFAGAKLAADEINERGGIRSLGGAKIELVVGDSQSKPEAAVAEVDKLSEAGVACFLGGYASGIGLTASQAAARQGVPFMSDTPVSDQITGRGLPGVFRFGPGFATITTAALDALVAINDAAGKPAKTVILVHEDGAFGSGMAKFLAAELPKRGFQVLDSIAHPTPTRDFTNIGLRLRAARPDIVMPSSYLNEYTLLARSIHQHRVPVKGIFSVIGGGASNFKFIREYNAAAQYIMDCNHWIDPNKPRSKRFVKALEERKVDLTYEVMLNYACMLLIADAIERAGSTDRAKISAAIASSTFEDHIMPYGPTKFVGGQNQGAQPATTQVQKMDIEVIWPQQFATAKAIFPIPQA